ncbi:aminotransferase class V [Gemmatirosa kalamazoonensis]|uniref:Aminotransferase class V n=1 Tax=Gemmatirosa kalamazoonensis TaxID=861299 RepID=W0RH41_9BACT|nr:aminotransferase class V-fold PLP-dependent enzyme [Gemmatirosa kalamazoonensis]AHG89660.1 aminotransferase class V [Gemmatirosa kalamazoonensis]
MLPRSRHPLSRRAFVGRAAGALGTTLGTAVVADFGTPRRRAIAAAADRLRHGAPADAADDEQFWREVRAAFTVAPSIVNLDNGNVSPSPRVVTESLVRHLEMEQDAPVLVRDMLGPGTANLARELAALLGCAPEEVAVTRNATEALHTVLLGYDLRPGDEVLTTTHDYWAMQNALDQRAARDGIVVKRVAVPVPAASMEQLRETIEGGMTPRTRLVLVSQPVNLTGQFFPVKQICEMAHARGADVVVDGAQGFAHVDFKIADLGCDYYAASLHKWLMAPIGTGLLYGRRDKLAKVWPLLPTAPAAPKDVAWKFMDIGTRSMAPFVAIGDAMHFHETLGAARKEARLRFLTRTWADRLAKVPKVRFSTSFASPEMSCGLASFSLDGVDDDALQRFLRDRLGILVQSIRYDRASFRGVRVTPNVYTSPADLDAFCDAVERVAAKGLPPSGRS